MASGSGGGDDGGDDDEQDEARPKGPWPNAKVGVSVLDCAHGLFSRTIDTFSFLANLLT